MHLRYLFQEEIIVACLLKWSSKGGSHLRRQYISAYWNTFLGSVSAIVDREGKNK